MLPALILNIELHNIINLLIAVIALLYIIRAGTVDTPLSRFYHKLVFIVFIILIFEGILFNMLLYNKLNDAVAFRESLFSLNNLYIVLAVAGLWFFYLKKFPQKRYRFAYYSLITLSVLVFVVLLIVFLSNININILRIRYAIQGFISIDLKIRVLYILIIVFAIASLALFLSILISRIYQSYILERNRQYRAEIQDLISDYVSAEKDQTSVKQGNISRLSEYIKNNNAKTQITVNTTLDLKKNLSGDDNKKIIELFKVLDLPSFSRKKLKSILWYKKAQGIRELTQMDITDARDDIRPFIDSRHITLREEAVFAVSRLYGAKSPVSFLADYKYKLTDWEQINIINNSNINKEQITDIDLLLKSNNETVLIFALRLIGFFRLDKYFSVLVDIIKHHPKPEIRSVCYSMFKQLNILSDNNLLIENYYNETYENKLMILEAMQAQPQDTYFSFLKSLAGSAKDFKTRLLVCKAIEATGSPLNLYLETLAQDNPDMAPFVSHAKEKRI